MILQITVLIIGRPPGTGKTSLSFALAGVFGLDIYSLALSEASLTEEDLVLLFNSLPKRCILLLEDVDTAGLGRAQGVQKVVQKQNANKKSSSEKGKKKESIRVAENDKEGGPATPSVQAIDVPATMTKEPTFKNTITLSGLLNAVDGVASQEGRVLIMVSLLHHLCQSSSFPRGLNSPSALLIESTDHQPP
jgi:mitochondrial chaperone BCS1